MQKNTHFGLKTKKNLFLVGGILEFEFANSLPTKSTLKEYKEKCNAILNFSYKK